ncbi:MAG: beta-ribofuranosylaminobenzene 5'-phosphate synthase family protein [Hyphomicrobium sp.]
MREQPPTPHTVRVEAPARLHLGFLDLNGGLGRRFGSIGLAVDAPATRLTVARAAHHSATGAESARALRLLGRFTSRPAGQGYAVHVDEAIPAHAGLGSGTQLALAIGAAVARLEGRQLTAYGLAQLGERGARSGIGLAAFVNGGFLVDGGRGTRDVAPPVLMRQDFPDAWRALMIFDPGRAGVSGDAELEAFRALPPFPDADAAHICRLVLMKLAPALIETDLPTFGAALTEIQAIVGGHFANAQGGSPWSSAQVGRLAGRMADLGATGIGQSSWGPTGFGFVENQQAAERLYHSLVGDAKAVGLDILIARGRNSGARITPV